VLNFHESSQEKILLSPLSFSTQILKEIWNSDTPITEVVRTGHSARPLLQFAKGPCPLSDQAAELQGA
jgi:hypothetical protein